jgi:hypothetical protein
MKYATRHDATASVEDQDVPDSAAETLLIKVGTASLSTSALASSWATRARVGDPPNTVCPTPSAMDVQPVLAPEMKPQRVSVSPMLQLQVDPGSIPAASTSATNVATGGSDTATVVWDECDDTCVLVLGAATALWEVADEATEVAEVAAAAGAEVGVGVVDAAGAEVEAVGPAVAEVEVLGAAGEVADVVMGCALCATMRIVTSVGDADRTDCGPASKAPPMAIPPTSVVNVTGTNQPRCVRLRAEPKSFSPEGRAWRQLASPGGTGLN